MASEPIAEQQSEENAVVAQATNTVREEVAEHESEDVSLDELMMDDDAADEGEPSVQAPQSDALPLQAEGEPTEGGATENALEVEPPQSARVEASSLQAEELSADSPEAPAGELAADAVDAESTIDFGELSDSASAQLHDTQIDAPVGLPARNEAPEPSESAQPVPAQAGVEISAKTGNTSPLPALDLQASRPPPSNEPERSASSVAPPRGESAVPALNLAALEEDEDDAVTQIGLSLHDVDPLPPAPSLSSSPRASSLDSLASHTVDPSVQGLDSPYLPMPPAASRPVFQQSRSAATVVVSRVDPAMIPGGVPPEGRAVPSAKPQPWFQQLVRPRGNIPAFGEPGLPARRKGANIVSVLPKAASWAVFAAGIIAVTLRWVVPSQGESTEVQALRAAEPNQLAAAAVTGEGVPTAMDHLAAQEGEVAKTRREFSQFIQQVKQGGAVNNRHDQLMRFASDSATRVSLFRELASWTSSEGPDIIYALWENAPGGSPVANLAFQLLYTADQRTKASPALQAVLALRTARTCEDYKAVLPRVLEHADRRALLSLRPLTHKDGCGEDGSEDCYSCLRANGDLTLALAAAQARTPPAY